MSVSFGSAGLIVVLLCTTMASAAAQPAKTDQRAAARQALAEGRYSDAEAIYRAMLRKTPASAGLLTDLGVALDVQGKSAEAEAAFQKSLQLRADPRTYVLLAKERCERNESEAVRPMLTAIVKDDRGRSDLLRVIAPCLMKVGDPVEAVDLLRELAEDPATTGDRAYVDLSRAYLVSAQYFFRRLHVAVGHEAYEKALQEAREGETGSARGAYDLGATESKLFRADATYGEAAAAWRQQPNSPALLYQMCVLSGEGSLATLEKLRQHFPSSPLAGQLVAEILADQGRRDEARAQYEQLLKMDPELPDLRDGLGMLLVQQQDWSAALPIFQEQLAHHPADQQATAHVSQCLLELARFEELKAFLQPRAAAVRSPLWLRLDLATALQQTGDNPGAIAQLVVAEKAFPSDRSVHYRLLRLYTASGDTEAAAREKALFEAAR